MTKNRPQHAPTVGPRSFLSAMIGALLLCVALSQFRPLVHPSPRPQEPISSVPQPLLKNFSIFRSPSEVVPPEIAEGVAKLGGTPLAGQGFSTALGQEVTLPGVHAPLWVIPGRDQVMLFDQPTSRGVGSTTATIPKVVKRGIGVFDVMQKSKWQVKGIVPDGITGVRLSKTAVAPVVDNAFVRSVKKANFWEAQEWIFIRAKGPIAGQS